MSPEKHISIDIGDPILLYKFPSPFKDESFFSLISRYHILGGGKNSKDTLFQLFGISGYIPSSLLPTRLDYFCSLTGFDIDKIVNQNTLWKLYLPFYSNSRRKELLELIKYGPGISVKSKAGLLANQFAAHEPLSFCEKCIVEDREFLGVSIWRLHHQIPSVMLCSLHNQELCVVPKYGKRINRHSLCLPHQIPREKAKIKDVGFKNYNWTKFCASFIQRNFSGFEVRKLQLTYIEKLKSQKLACNSGRLKLELLVDSIFFFYRRYSSSRCLPVFENRKRINNYIRMIFRKDGASHPIYHYLMINYLFATIDEFYSAYSKTPFIEPSLSSQNLKSDNETISSKFKYVDKFLKTPLLSDLKNGLEINFLSQKYNTSAITLRRILKKYPSIRKIRADNLFKKELDTRRSRILDAIKSEKIRDRKTFRARYPSDFIWSYRHDRYWLNERFFGKQVPVRQVTRVDWQARDIVIAENIKKISKTLIEAGGKPVRISKAEIARQLKKPYFLDKYLSKMPKSKEALNSVNESLSNYQIRRIFWAYLELKKDNLLVQTSYLKRLAGIGTKVDQIVNLFIVELISQDREGTLNPKIYSILSNFKDHTV